MLHSIAVWLLVAAFVGAGLFNAIGTRATQDDFARWGYPRWWCRVTGAIEIVAAALIAFPAGRNIGMAVGAVIITVAVVTILRRREFSHTAPLGIFAALLVLAAATS
ncbi:DoxX family protein [Sphingomonas endolithica]|uniref:DoxX family protein n=1 Tax=Sphingomonas endolithica TaxID=2972485 RepID=UPI0021AE5F13|nr:DoxX family protein [Sphingomonas sp. ZFBP2030]